MHKTGQSEHRRLTGKEALKRQELNQDCKESKVIKVMCQESVKDKVFLNCESSEATLVKSRLQM